MSKKTENMLKAENMLKQHDISKLMTAWEDAMVGYPRVVILLAAARIMAAMLGPAAKKSQDEFIEELPALVRGNLQRILEMKRAHDQGLDS